MNLSLIVFHGDPRIFFTEACGQPRKEKESSGSEKEKAKGSKESSKEAKARKETPLAGEICHLRIDARDYKNLRAELDVKLVGRKATGPETRNALRLVPTWPQ